MIMRRRRKSQYKGAQCKRRISAHAKAAAALYASTGALFGVFRGRLRKKKAAGSVVCCDGGGGCGRLDDFDVAVGADLEFGIPIEC